QRTQSQRGGPRARGLDLDGCTTCGRTVGRPIAPAQPLDADSVDDVGGALDRRADVRRPQIHSPTFVLEQCAHHRTDPVRPGDRGQRQRQERAAGFACSHGVVRCRGLVRLGNDLRSGTLAQHPPATPSVPHTVILGKLTMTLINFFVGLPVMLLCLIVQATVAFWSVRHFVRQTESIAGASRLLQSVRPLLTVMLVMMFGSLVQMSLWGALFVYLGEFDDLYQAIYHSAVNFTSLGYGDVVMGAKWKLLGPLEAMNGVLMLGMSAAALMAILQEVIKLQRGA